MKKNFFLTLSIFFVALTYGVAQHMVTGVLTDGTEPLIGVNVIEQGTTNGTITDINGKYEIKVSDNASLIFSLIGYDSKTVSVNGQSVLDFVMTEGVQLDEVVVTALGIKREQKALGYAITKVDGDQLSQVKTTSAVNSLQGRVAGVNISNNSGGAAGSSRVIIRGASSLTGDNQPLYVIDGIPMINNTNGSVVGPFGGEHGDGGDDISTLNPDDIESMSVLKGSSAAALYGSLASNGVIMITTKSGKGQDKLGVEFSSSYTFDQVNTDLFDMQTTYGQGNNHLRPGYEYNDDGSESEISDTKLAVDDSYTSSLQSWGQKYDGSSVYNWDGVKRPYSYTGNNIDKFFETGTTATNTIALSKGTDAYNYRFSYSNLNNNDIFPNSTLKRNSFSLNAGANINPRLLSTVNIKYVNEKIHNRVTIGDTPGNANTIAWLLPGSLDILDLKPGINEDGTELRHQSSQFRTNPYWVANHFNNNDLRNRITASTSLRYNITDWLYATGRAGVDSYILERKKVTPYGTAYRPAGELTQAVNNNRSTDIDLMLGMDKSITDKISTNTIVGVNTRHTTFKGLSATGRGFVVVGLEDLNNTTLPEPKNSYSEYKTNSVYGSVGMDYGRMFYLTFTGRNDWFSTLSYPGKTTPNNDFYWSLSSSFLLNEALNLPSSIDLFKLRASYAQVAGGARIPYQLNLDYAVTGSFQGQTFGQLNGAAIPNPNLVPFQKNEFEIGLDGRFFKNKLFLDLAYYTNNTTNDIVSAAASISSGYTSAVLNIGELSNNGVELLIGGTPIQKTDFSWNTSFNIGYNKSEIVHTDDEDTPINVDNSLTRSKNALISHIVGEQYGVIFGSTYKRDSVSGKIIYDNKGNIPKAVQGENEILGNGVAPLTLGFYNSFQYKAFSLGFLIDGKFGGNVHSGTNLALTANGLHGSTLDGREDGLTITGIDSETGDEFTKTIEPKDLRTYYGFLAAENSGIAEAFVYSTDFIKFRELSLSYQLPKSMLSKIKVSDLRLSVVGRNLFFLMREIENIDPESALNNRNSQGIERFGLPATRSLGFSINVKF